jgi:hypothetical protein
MKDKIKAVKITITYYGVGLTKDQAIANAWNDISNDNNFNVGIIDEQECDIEQTNFDNWYLDQISQGE